MLTEPEPTFDSRQATPPFFYGCLIGPLVCIACLAASALTMFAATRQPEPYFVPIAIVIVPVACVVSGILGAVTGAAVAHYDSIFKGAGMSALVSFPFSIAVGVFCSGEATEAFVSLGLFVTFVGTITGVIVTILIRRRERIRTGPFQLRLNEMLFLSVLLALGLLLLGVQYRSVRAHSENFNRQPATREAG